ncbi:MAG: NAD(P)/FAD-dependent oxidoreductase [Thermoplasmata archaeon HGW-Thermoplasmata-1]|nr:MAG: NAD(P)/FAD-dependent oxidoreductase [Thermoplasmata archaeon HGW-Thermoplasmata-1]
MMAFSNDYDVVVAGAGPAGSVTARELARRGFSVLLCEEHPVVGEPVQCAGLVSPRTLSENGIGPSDPLVQNTLTGADIVFPGGRCITIDAKEPRAYAINRSRFDRILAERAAEAGAELVCDCKFVDARRRESVKGLEVLLLDGKKEASVNCRLLVGADGPSSLVRRTFSLPEPAEFVRGYEAEYEGTSFDAPNRVTVLFGNRVAPGFFAWAIPVSKEGDTARIGLCIGKGAKGTPKSFFEGLIEHSALTPHIRDAAAIGAIAGKIPLGPLRRSTADNAALVGDAAAQVKPTSGGGVYTATLCAKLCAEACAEALSSGDLSKKSLGRYHSLWSKSIGKELGRGMAMRMVFRNLGDRSLDALGRSLDDPGILDTINAYGDIDYPSIVAGRLMKKAPALFKNLLFN